MSINTWEALNTWSVAVNAPPGATTVGAAASDQTILAAWGSLASATGYRVYLDGVPLDVGDTTSHIFTGLTNGQTYEIYVVAYNLEGDGPDSNKVSRTPSEPSSGGSGPVVRTTMVSTRIVINRIL